MTVVPVPVLLDAQQLDRNIKRFHQQVADAGCVTRAHLKAHRTTVPVATFSMVRSNMVNEWCELAADAPNSNAIKTVGSKLILFISYSFVAGSVVL